MEAVKNAYGYFAFNGGKYRLMVQNLCAVISQLRCFAVRDLPQSSRLRHLRWICGQNAIDISPYPHLMRIKRRCENRCGIIRAPSPKGRHDTFGRSANKTCDDWNRPIIKQAHELVSRNFASFFIERFGRAKLVVSDNEFGRRNSHGPDATGRDGSRKNRRSEQLSRCRNRIEQSRAQLVNHRKTKTKLFEAVQMFANCRM